MLWRRGTGRRGNLVFPVRQNWEYAIFDAWQEIIGHQNDAAQYYLLDSLFIREGLLGWEREGT